VASTRKTETKRKEKTADLPPTGPRNPDPITDAAGAHPIETGIGATIGGAAAGAIAGAVGGPLGAVAGAIAGGGLLGGLAGKGVGELIDPTIEDAGVKEYYRSEKNRADGATADTYRPAYRYGLASGSRYEGQRFEDVEPDLRGGWESARGDSALSWDEARGAARHAFDRTIQLREENLKADKRRVKSGDVTVRKEVVTEERQITVPVEREEVVIQRRPVKGRAATGGVKAEEIRIPVSEERVDVRKETEVKEEVSVGRRKVTENKTVGGTVRKEKLKVEEQGNARVKGNARSGNR
jgi:uncharacterized protein (TIGR02271 family)